MWDLSVEEIGDAIEGVIRFLEKTYKMIMAIPEEQQSFENTLGVLSDTFCSATAIINKVTFLKYVHHDENVRKASEQADIKIENFFTELETRKHIYDFIISIRKRFYDKVDSCDKRYIDFLVKSFERAGVCKGKKQKILLKKIHKMINNLSAAYNFHATENKYTIPLGKEDLVGVHEHILANIEKKGDIYSVPLKHEVISHILTFADDETTRKKAGDAYKLKCNVNIEVLFHLVTLRKGYAALLGYKSYGDYILESRMAKSRATVDSFLEGLQRDIEPLCKKELSAMRSMKGSDVYIWDKMYYTHKYKKETFKITDRIEDYFYMDHVLEVMFKKYNDIFNVKILAKNSGPESMWHNDVREYDVFSSTSELFGTFALDLFARDGKYDHFACFSIKYRINDKEGVRTPAYCVLMGNFAPPNPEKEKVALLSHKDLQTLYHEFGHVMHNVLGGAHHSLFSGTHVEWDFIEMPSQMLENLCWEFDNIKALSEHWQTKTQLSDADINALISSRYYNKLEYRTQIMYAKIDQLLHGNRVFKDADDMVGAVQAIIDQLSMEGDVGEIAVFGHLATEYAATYYGYLWSEIYAQDIYAAIDSPQQWEKYVSLILSQGGSKDADVMLRNFLKREPNNKAFMASLGI